MRAVLIVFVLLPWVPLKAETPKVDPSSGLVVAPGWQMVQAHCSACHSLKLVTTQRGDREYWLELIRWMQKTQNLWDLPPAVETQVLDYLSTHYREDDWGRRPPLPARLLPDTS
ncbi:MAG: hypothetical protein AAF574_11920 [Pseudomonadota bacterium]